MKFLFTCLLLSLSLHASQKPENLEELVRSPIWQVRYGVASEFSYPLPESREALELLSKDKNHSVARHAFSLYSRIFLDLDRTAVDYAFERGDFQFLGMHCFSQTSTPSITTSAFWINELKEDLDSADNGRTIQILGLIGDSQALPKLKDYEAARNPYVLQNLGITYYRLKNLNGYKSVMLSVFDLPIEETLHYYTTTIDYLLQSHPNMASELWNRVNAQVVKGTDIQPNWVYAHFLQESRIPNLTKPNQAR